MTPTPTSELAEKLERACAGYSNGRTSMDVELILQAADTLRKQAEELERCRTALRPFAHATLLNQSALIIAGDAITQAFDSGKKHVTIIMEDDAAEAFNAARSAYNEPKQNGEAK